MPKKKIHQVLHFFPPPFTWSLHPNHKKVIPYLGPLLQFPNPRGVLRDSIPQYPDGLDHHVRVVARHRQVASHQPRLAT